MESATARAVKKFSGTDSERALEHVTENAYMVRCEDCDQQLVFSIDKGNRFLVEAHECPQYDSEDDMLPSKDKRLEEIERLADRIINNRSLKVMEMQNLLLRIKGLAGGGK